MSSFNVDFEMQLQVTLHNPDAAKDYFIDGDWKESFYTLDDIEDLVRLLANAFQCEADCYSPEHRGFVRNVEGFGVYVRSAGADTYELDDECQREIGTNISVSITDELEPTFVTAANQEA